MQLQQVLVNLLRNACDAVGENDFDDRQIFIRARRLPGRAELTVEDRGPGIAPEHRDKLFEAFFTTKSDGIGMGLAISRSIIEAHCGRLWVESAQPHGSKFHIKLPSVVESRSVA